MNMSSRFKGALVAGLIGDCYGAVFENERRAAGSVLNAFFNKRAGPKFKGPYLKYTDDTALTICVLDSLVAKKNFDERDLAFRFVKSYFNEPHRGYAGGAIDLFVAMRATDCENPIGLSKRQFGGSGSFGNGGAMRVCPVPLFCYNKDEDFLINMSRQTAEVTHANRLGYNGAILQSLAIYKALKSSEIFDVDEYLEYLISHMTTVEKLKENEIGNRSQDEFAYTNALKVVKTLLEKNETDVEQIIIQLGTDVVAIRSVPTAVYVFLRAMNPIKGIEATNPVHRTIQFAISLGGDTDTIATMAGSIAGAFYGIEEVPWYLQKHCELISEVTEKADELFAATG